VRLVSELAQPRDIGAGLAELVLRQPHLAGEIMQVAHQRRHDLFQALIGGALQLAEDGGGHILLGPDDH
jgi:hypothetical protein